MRSRVFVLIVLPALLTAGAALAASAGVVANDEATTTSTAPPLALNASPPTTVSLLPFFPLGRGRRLLKLDAGLAKPSSLNDTEETSSTEDEKDKKDSGGGSSSSSSKTKSDRSVSSCSRIRGGRFRCSEGANEAEGPLGTMGG